MVAGGGASVVYRYRSQGWGAGSVAMEMSLWGGTVCHAVTAWDLPGMKVLCRCLPRMWNAVSFRSDNLTLGGWSKLLFTWEKTGWKLLMFVWLLWWLPSRAGCLTRLIVTGTKRTALFSVDVWPPEVVLSQEFGMFCSDTKIITNLLNYFCSLIVTLFVTWGVWMNWQTMANTQEPQVSSRPMTMPRLFSPSWLERNTLKVRPGTGAVVN